MYCRNCGKEVLDQAVVCVNCGVNPKSGGNYCHNCGAETNPAAEVCIKCGVKLGGGSIGESSKSRVVAGLLGIFLGSLGIHRFYLGYTAIGFIQLTLALGGLITCGLTSTISALWGLIEGILIFMGTINKDAQGNPLKD
jgi:TM2 domain-containing membrane protein YozV